MCAANNNRASASASAWARVRAVWFWHQGRRGRAPGWQPHLQDKFPASPEPHLQKYEPNKTLDVHELGESRILGHVQVHVQLAWIYMHECMFIYIYIYILIKLYIFASGKISLSICHIYIFRENISNLQIVTRWENLQPLGTEQITNAQRAALLSLSLYSGFQDLWSLCWITSTYVYIYIYIGFFLYNDSFCRHNNQLIN